MVSFPSAASAIVASRYAIAGEVENLAGQYLDILAAGLEPVILDEAEMERVAEGFLRYGKAG